MTLKKTEYFISNWALEPAIFPQQYLVDFDVGSSPCLDLSDFSKMKPQTKINSNR